MLEYEVDVDSEKLERNLRRWEREMPNFIGLLFRRFGTKLEALAAQKSKQVLNVITGRLSTSMFSRTLPYQLHVGGGNDVSYARVHELGFSGTVTVRRHKRSVVFGRPVAPFFVPAHQRRVNIPARPYVRPSIEAFFRGGGAEDIARGVFREQKRRYGFE